MKRSQVEYQLKKYIAGGILRECVDAIMKLHEQALEQDRVPKGYATSGTYVPPMEGMVRLQQKRYFSRKHFWKNKRLQALAHKEEKEGLDRIFNQTNQSNNKHHENNKI